jgi:hypothetical protein
MAESTIVKTKRDGTLTFSDNAAANSYTVAFEAGDMNVSIPGRTINLFLDRGEITSPPSIRWGDDQPMTATFTAQLRDVSDVAVAVLTDLITNGGFFASGWVSTGGANAEVKTVDCLWTIEGSDHGDPADHTVTLPYCFVTGSIADGDPVTLSISLTSYAVYPTVA